MYWWDFAAELLTRKGTRLKRFGLVTTNSITQIFNRRVVENHIRGKNPISIIMAIPDHPWTKATKEFAAVRIAMTVGELGKSEGIISTVVHEERLDTDDPLIQFETKQGAVNIDLTIGVDVTLAKKLESNTLLASMGPALGGRGFVVNSHDLKALGADTDTDWAKRLTTGKDIVGRHRNRFVIDVRKFEDEASLRLALPKVYQHLKIHVYPSRAKNNDPKLREFWWKFRRTNETYFNAIDGLKRFIATVETTKHRAFVFVSSNELLEHGVIGFGLSDGWHLGVFSSRTHVVWALASGGTLEDRPRYNKDVCFDPFPFPEPSDALKSKIRATAEELDALRKQTQAEHPGLTLTQIYNVLEKLRAGEKLNDAEEDIKTKGLVLIVKELHDRLDGLVAQAYGWPENLSDEEILARLVALNHERAAEEKRGLIRWLRPDYQRQRAGIADTQAAAEAETQIAAKLVVEEKTQKPSFPTSDLERTASVFAALVHADRPLDAQAIAKSFRQGAKVEPTIARVLASLARLGHVHSGDGKSFTLRRAA
jgi:Fe2+ or Zn2+ uptake regulation protein